jgi:hypothetical protein
MDRLREVLKDVHLHPSTWFTYLVGASIALRASIDDLDHYLKPVVVHGILAGAALFVLIDRIRKSVLETKPDV